MNVVYLMRFADGSAYVGSSCSYAERRRTHRRHMKNGKHQNRLIQAAYERAGLPGFEHIASAFRREDLHLVEAAVIDQLRPSLNRQRPSRVPAPEETAQRAWGPYPSLKVAAAELGLSYTQCKRLAAAFSYEAALYKIAYQKPKKLRAQPPDRRVLVSGVLALPREHCARLGISMPTYRKRLRAGGPLWSTTMPAQPRTITAAGQTRTLAGWEAVSGIRRLTITKRLDKLGWTPEQAVGLELREPAPSPVFPDAKRVRLDVDGDVRTLREWAREIGVREATLYMRVRSGWTPRQAVGLDPRKSSA